MIPLFLLMALLSTHGGTLSLVSHTLFQPNTTTQFKNLSSYSANLMTSHGSQAIALFGGTMSGSAKNTMIIAILANSTTTVNTPSMDIPPPRYGHCALSDGDSLYVYGGVGIMGTMPYHLSDLWQFNSSTLVWQSMGNSSFQVSHCNMMKSGSSLMVFGVDMANSLEIWQYSLTVSSWRKVPYSYGYAVVGEGATWQKDIQETQTLIENLSPFQTIITSDIVYSTLLPIKNIRVVTNDNQNYYIVGIDKIVVLMLSDMTINWVRNLEKLDAQFECQISKEWLFIIQTFNDTVQLNYYNLSDLYKSSVKIYQHPQPSSNLTTFIFNEDIYFISSLTLNGYILQKNCNDSLNQSYLVACFYGETFCRESHRGPTCTQRSCPNTLALTDLTIFSSIILQCNNHGTCTDNGCQCEEHWRGNDCSIYTRSVCYGQLLDNWPVMNCECLNETTGGNNCEVTFCYNDCSEQGTCLSTGVCVCNKGYYGVDCSIVIIEFPQAEASI